MPLDPIFFDEDSAAWDSVQEPADHSGARWMVAVGLCLVMLGLACTL